MAAVLASVRRRPPAERELQRIEPSQQIGITFPSGSLAVPQSWVSLLQCFPLGLDVCFSVEVRRIKMSMAQPTSDDCNVNAGRNQVNCNRVPKGVGRNLLSRQ